jgi:hypothetical protein
MESLTKLLGIILVLLLGLVGGRNVLAVCTVGSGADCLPSSKSGVPPSAWFMLRASRGSIIGDLQGNFNRTINPEALSTFENGRAYPLGAKGNGLHDDYLALQNAIDAACDGTPSGGKIDDNAPPPVIIPTGVWLHSQPLRLFCALNFSGYSRGNGGMNSNMISRLTQNYWGPVVIQEGLGSDNLTYTRALRTCAGRYCGAIDMTADGGASHYLSLSQFLIKGPDTADISNASTLSFRVVLKVPNLSSIGNGCIVDYKNPFGNQFDPGIYRGAMFQLCIDSSGHTHDFAVTGGDNEVSAGGISTDSGFTAGTTHEMLIQIDGMNLIAFRDGVPVLRNTLSGSLHTVAASGNGYLNMLNFPSGGGNETWPNGNNGNPGVAAIYDSYRVEKGAIIKTCPLTTAVPVVGIRCYEPSPYQDNIIDSNTILLINGWKRCTEVGQTGCSVDGTQYAQTGLKSISPTGAVYIPVLTGASPKTSNSGAHVHDLELCDSTGGGSETEAFVAIWSFQSEFDHLHCLNNSGVAFDFFSNDWDSYVHDMSVLGGVLAYDFGGGNHFGESTVDRVTSDSTAVHEFVNGPGIVQSYSQWAPRGRAVVGWIYDNTKLDDRFSFMDAEESDPNQIGTMIINAPYGLMNFESFENAENPNNVRPFLIWIGSGQTAQFTGPHAFYRGAPMVSYVNWGGTTSKPSTPITFVSCSFVATGVSPSNLKGCSSVTPANCYINFVNDPRFGNLQQAFNSTNNVISDCSTTNDGDRERVSDGSTAGCPAGANYMGGGSHRCWVSCVGAQAHWEFTGEIW